MRLSASLGSQLTGVCYVLDEPTVGLHARDTEALTDALRELVERGNSVLVVEHDPAVMQRADWIDLGPGAGHASIVASAPPAELARHPSSKTAAALRGEIVLAREARESVQAARQGRVELRGASGHNLVDAAFGFAFGALTGVCGPSGSGKSTLVLDCLVPALRGERPQGRWKSLAGFPADTRVVVVDAAPLGRTPASIPATYNGLMQPLRELYARTPEARARGWDAGRFSFNSPKGRCAACEGKGAVKVEMQFLADLWLECEECGGKRYAPEVLEVHWRGRSIADALELSAEEALSFFEHQPALVPPLSTLCDVGLSYLQLGQSSTTLSGGEAQRVKLAAELFRAESGGRSVLVLDEPTTGWRSRTCSTSRACSTAPPRARNAVIVIEHHIGLLAICDELVELRTGGEAGGRASRAARWRKLCAARDSVTGPFLARELAPPGRGRPRARAEVLR